MRSARGSSAWPVCSTKRATNARWPTNWKVTSNYTLKITAGMTSLEARRQAPIKLGGIEQTKELYRDRQALPLVEISSTISATVCACARTPA